MVGKFISCEKLHEEDDDEEDDEEEDDYLACHSKIAVVEKKFSLKFSLSFSFSLPDFLSSRYTHIRRRRKSLLRMYQRTNGTRSD